MVSDPEAPMNHTHACRVGVLGFLLLSSASCASRTAAGADAPAGSQQMDISPASARPTSRGMAANLAGSATLTTLFAANDHRRGAAASVTFDPSARSAWHSHPDPAMGWAETGAQGRRRDLAATRRQALARRDCDPAMTHIAIQEHVDGKAVTGWSS
jgi:hypothetical protein